MSNLQNSVSHSLINKLRSTNPQKDRLDRMVQVSSVKHRDPKVNFAVNNHNVNASHNYNANHKANANASANPNTNHTSSSVPYFLDFNTIDNTNTDRLGRVFRSETDIDKSQKQINRDLFSKLTDYTQKYTACREENNPKSILKVRVSNSEQPTNFLLTSTDSSLHHGQARLPPSSCEGYQKNPHELWGISNRQTSETMSDSFLAMKNMQELTQLENNSYSYPGLIDEVKAKQAYERQRQLEMSSNNVVRSGPVAGSNACQNLHGSGVNMNLPGMKFTEQQSSDKIYVDHNSFNKTETTCLTADGQWTNHNPNLYLQKNKYEHLKKMTPDDLNRSYGKPVAGDVAPPSNMSMTRNGVDGQQQQPRAYGQCDVFDMTSFSYNIHKPKALGTLESANQKSMDAILRERSSLQGSNRDDPFSDYLNNRSNLDNAPLI